MERGGYIYLMTNKNDTVIYTGVTSNLANRVWEHKNKVHVKSFSARYNLCKLVYYETFLSIEEAIVREKQIKDGSRQMKLDLIKRLP